MAERMMIYFIEAGIKGPIKIGKSTNVGNRLRALQTHHYEQLHVLGVMEESDLYAEKSLHRRFRSRHIRGEWYKPGRALSAFITKHTHGILLPRRFVRKSERAARLTASVALEQTQREAEDVIVLWSKLTINGHTI